MGKNDLSHLFEEINTIDLHEVAPLFFLQGNEKELLPKLEQLIDYEMHTHLIGKTVLLKYVFNEKGFVPITNSVFTHDSLPGWILKGQHNISYIKRDFDHLLRPVMAKKMQEVIRVHNLDIAIPEKRYVPSFFSSSTAKKQESYYILVEQFDCITQKEMANYFLSLEAVEIRHIARTLALFIAHTGYQDLHTGNIRFSKEGKLCILDTEPWGMLVEVDNEKPHNQTKKAKSVESGLNRLAKTFHLFSRVHTENNPKRELIKKIFEEEAARLL
jgi:hypothetical protein